jgi:hypothetical protein
MQVAKLELLATHVLKKCIMLCIKALLKPHKKGAKCWLIQLTKCMKQHCLLKRSMQKHKKTYLKNSLIISNANTR